MQNHKLPTKWLVEWKNKSNDEGKLSRQGAISPVVLSTSILHTGEIWQCQTYRALTWGLMWPTKYGLIDWRETYVVIPSVVVGVVDDRSTQTSGWVDSSSCNGDGCQVYQKHGEPNGKWSKHLQEYKELQLDIKYHHHHQQRHSSNTSVSVYCQMCQMLLYMAIQGPWTGLVHCLCPVSRISVNGIIDERGTSTKTWHSRTEVMDFRALRK